MLAQPQRRFRIGAPECYTGEPEGCNPFLTNCSIFFALQPHTFASEGAKVMFTINQLTGRVRLWGTAEWERRTRSRLFLLSCVSGDSGCPPWRGMCGSSSRHAPLVTNTSRLTCTPASHLHPLAVPHCPWFHISLDFVTGLPPSAGNTTILRIVDRFSKTAHFIPLHKLPSTKETVELLLLHVVRLHGLPVDVVSDQGPQFTSIFWQEFCRVSGASVSLSSGFHPQSNSQSERMNQDMEGQASLPSNAPGYQPPLFPALEKELSCPSVEA